MYTGEVWVESRGCWVHPVREKSMWCLAKGAFQLKHLNGSTRAGLTPRRASHLSVLLAWTASIAVVSFLRLTTSTERDLECHFPASGAKLWLAVGGPWESKAKEFPSATCNASFLHTLAGAHASCPGSRSKETEMPRVRKSRHSPKTPAKSTKTQPRSPYEDPVLYFQPDHR